MGFLKSLFVDPLREVGKTLGTVWNDITGQTANNEFNAQEAQKQRDYEERMSNTAVQRQVEDMKSAGINPAMAYVNGATGASTPTGSSAHSSAGGGANGVASLINSAANMAHVMNNDKSKHNNMTVGDTVKLINTIARLF